MKKFRKVIFMIIAVTFFVAVSAVLFGVYCNWVVSQCQDACFERIDALPEKEWALLPGAAKLTPAGNPNLYFAARIDAAAKLYHAGKIKYILISGDHSSPDYNEPGDMKQALLEKGVPESAITLDHAGFSTLESVVRAGTVFGIDDFVVISQKFHAERAIYIAGKFNIKAIGFAAGEPDIAWLVKRNCRREKFARIAAWLDVNIVHLKARLSQ